MHGTFDSGYIGSKPMRGTDIGVRTTQREFATIWVT